MRFIGNLLWFIFGGGLLACLSWCLLGALLCITIIGIPPGIAAFRIAGFAAWPFGRQLIDKTILSQKRIPGTALANLLWILFAGLWLAIAHVISGIAYCLTIIFIPFGLAHFKLAAVCFAPLGKCAVPNAVAQAAIAAHAQRQVNFVPAPTTSSPTITQLQSHIDPSPKPVSVPVRKSLSPARVIFVILLISVMAYLLASFTGYTNFTVTPTNIDRIDYGMTIEQVQNILGPGDQSFSDSLESAAARQVGIDEEVFQNQRRTQGSVTLKWREWFSVYSITFRNGRALRMSYSGPRTEKIKQIFAAHEDQRITALEKSLHEWDGDLKMNRDEDGNLTITGGDAQIEFNSDGGGFGFTQKHHSR